MRTLPRSDKKSAADIPGSELPGALLVGVLAENLTGSMRTKA